MVKSRSTKFKILKVKKLNKSVVSNVIYEGNIENVTEGKEYLVYGIEKINGETFYLLFLTGDYTIKLYNSRNFDVIDQTKSKYWVEDTQCKGRFLFKDWLKFDDYLEWFFNGVEFLRIDEFSCPVDYLPFYKEKIEYEG